MRLFEEEVWIITSKDRRLIAKGVPRNRYLCMIDGKEEKRILSYISKGRAESGFKHSGFYHGEGVDEYMKSKGYNTKDTWYENRDDFYDNELEAIKCTVSLNEVV